MRKAFIFLQKLLRDTSGIPLTQIPLDRVVLSAFLQEQTGHFLDTFSLENTTLMHKLLQNPTRADTIYEWIAPGGITFLLCADPADTSCLVLGPVLTQPFSQENTLLSLDAYPISSQGKSGILHFCSSLPVAESHILYRAGELVFSYLTGREQPMRIAHTNASALPESHLTHSVFTSEENIMQMRQVEARYEYSAALTDAVSQGNLSLALHLIGRYDPGTQTPVRNSNPLRNAQNYCIVLNTQLRHALETSGIHPYRVDRLSNEIGLEIEQLKSTKQLPNFFQQVIRRYCRLVQEHAYPNLKPLTHLAVTYIKEHLADNLTVKDTAKALTVNANYLSTLFHRDMGMTFIDFVNKERTHQAAALLKHTNLQIQQIASTVGYNNTSYFAKQFLRFHGITPSHYRREGTL